MMRHFYIKDNTGAIRVWSIGQLDHTVVIQYGQLGGAMQTRFEDVPHGKAGRTLQEQVESRINSRINKQLDAGYSPNLEDARSRPVNSLGFKKPMLAQPYSKVKKLDLSNVFVQPKFDGNRCMITMHNGKLIAYTRNGKIVAGNLDHIFAGLDLDEGDYIDGELYHHGTALQTIASWIKRNQEATKLLNFHAYDLMINAPYVDRFAELHRKVNGDRIIIAPTHIASGADAVLEMHNEFTNDGYEGAIIRWSDAGYEDGKRSKSLVKVKKFMDDYFYIVDIHPSKDGWAILECMIPSNGNTFRVSAPGTIAHKTDIYENRNDYLGRYARVEFMNYTKDGKPFHPVCTVIEDHHGGSV